VINLKKSRKIHLLAALLTLDLATIGVTCGVYANYANNAKATSKLVKMDEWGVVINAPVNTITNTSKNGVTLTYPEKIESMTAPGEKSDPTQNELIFTITGTPKANIDLTCNTKITVINPKKWTIKNNLNEDFVYFPIRFTLGNEQYTYKDIDITTEDKVYEYNTSEVLKAGESCNQTKQATWEWDYENRDGDIATYDSYDTKLGNSFENKEDAPQFKIEMTLTMESNITNKTSEPENTEGEPTPTPTPSSQQTPDTQSELYLSGNVGDTTQTDTAPEGMTLSGAVSTGDSFNLVLWIGVMAAAAVVITVSIILLLVFNKKDR
jgi:post-segregation antitoxin (ccd killing protein)